MLRTLCAWDFLHHDEEAERYSLGGRLLQLSRRAFVTSGLDHALMILHRLTDTTDESASLGVRNGTEVLVVLNAQSSQPIRFSRPPGSRPNLHVSAMGKALLAFGPQSIEEAVSSLDRLDKMTPATITSRKKLILDLRAAREHGFTLSDEEQYAGLRSVGAPVFDANGVARAAVSVQGLTSRVQDDRIEKLGAVVREVAQDLSEVLTLEVLAFDVHP